MNARLAVFTVTVFVGACGGSMNADPCALNVDERVRDVADLFSAPGIDVHSSALQIVAPSPLTTWRLEDNGAAVISWRPQTESSVQTERERSLVERVVE